MYTEFLRAHNPDGPWTVYALEPDGLPTGKSSANMADIVQFIEDNNGLRNIHFPVNRVLATTCGGKASKADLYSLDYLHIDLDYDADGVRLTSPDAKQRVIDQLNACLTPGPPSIIIDTGNGVQALWRLAEPLPPTPEGIDQLESYNNALIDQFHGDGGTWNADRILRVPGTLNLPNKKKLKAGLRVVQSNLRKAAEDAYFAWSFPAQTVPRALALDRSPIGPAVSIDTLDELSAYHLSDRVQHIITTGYYPDAADMDRSRPLFAAVVAMVAKSVPDSIIKGVLMDPGWGVSASVLDKPSPDQYSDRQIHKAHAWLGTQAATNDSDHAQVDESDTLAKISDKELAAAVSPQESDAYRPGSMPYVPRVIPFEDTKFRARIPESIPSRDWVSKPFYIRRQVTGTVAHGGQGKTILVLAECIALALGVDILGVAPDRRYTVVYWNGEDTLEEIERRIAAICIFYNLDIFSLQDTLYVSVGRQLPIELVSLTGGGTIAVPKDVDAVIDALKRVKADVFSVDPLISIHGVSENASEHMEKVAQAFNRICEEADVATHVAHHSVKRGRADNVSAMDMRGSGALLAKMRAVRVLNRMNKDTSKKDYGVCPNDAWRFIKIEGDKPNLAPPGIPTWMEMHSVSLNNATMRGGKMSEPDIIGVPAAWQPAQAPDGGYDTELFELLHERMGTDLWRDAPQATNSMPALIKDIFGVKTQLQVGRVKQAALAKGYIEPQDYVDSAKQQRTGYRRRPDPKAPLVNQE